MTDPRSEFMEEDTMKNKFLTFSIGEEVYGIEIRYVIEIIKIQPITKVPQLPDHIKGIINLRGKIIPVMDVRLKFKKEEKEYNDRTCIIVIDFMDISLGLIVDNVAEVINISEEDIVPPPNSKTGFTNKYIKGIGKVEEKVILILNCNTLLEDEEIDSVSEIS